LANKRLVNDSFGSSESNVKTCCTTLQHLVEVTKTALHYHFKMDSRRLKPGWLARTLRRDWRKHSKNYQRTIKTGARKWIRTTDLLITNQLLCQLSYAGV
jgi:hypothetical protein